MSGGNKLWGGALAALGIVFGDIGTSPLYTLQTVMSDTGNATDRATLLGSFSLLVWTMMLVVALKYATLVMRADNNGEGGILALLSLVGPRFGPRSFSRATLLAAAGLFGAALLYGDGAITPAISVLSAVGGISVVTHAVDPYVLPASVVILLGIFAVQPLGTAHIGRVFGPVMLLWFLAIGLIGLVSLLQAPAVLAGLDPLLALRFLVKHGAGSLVILGAVFLSVTGAEALYADMSHVGRASVRLSLGALVLPTLVLSYAGQVAFLIHHPGNKDNPFFAMLPHGLVLPMVALATVATVIASQAIITGSFTLTRQAMQLGWMPGLNIRQTSDTEYGQIYVPVVNWVLMLVTLAIAIGFGNSDRLSGAYGTAVSTTMLMTTLLIFDVMRDRWRWPLPVALGVSLFLALIDLAFFSANLLKIDQGGYIPLLIGLLIFGLMTTWRRGIDLVLKGLKPLTERADDVLREVREGRLVRTPGAAVFLSRYDSPVPPLMARHVASFRSLPETAIALAVRFEEVPRVAPEKRMSVRMGENGLWQIKVCFGFVEIPNLYAVLEEAKELGCKVDLHGVIFFAGDDDVVPHPQHPQMSRPRRQIFGFLYRNAVRAPDRFALPRDRLVEIGHQITV
ncbi:potassium transporter Kup [Rhizosaccharibacter radicis]|uniref:Probable potassium transport system protein Kup n=1 Tax=Rhizosaccharibacter radicis TaxID=2782605 RepID=A0ABT1VUL8_9PROT|nr:KUP/HAK/KT family potassium transporter [Acetobacteraceae bacterium KSS12]